MEVNICMIEKLGWKCIKREKQEIWYSGYLWTKSILDEALEVLKNLSSRTHARESIIRICRSLDGHFGIVIKTPEFTFAMTDRVSSVPLIYQSNGEKITIGNDRSLLKNSIELRNQGNYCRQAALEIAMSGYTLAPKTIYEGYYRFGPGEVFYLAKLSESMRLTYFSYQPFCDSMRDEITLKKELLSVMERSIGQLVDSCEGRQIVVPLSAGNDSRFIVSGLKEFGYKNVLCFSYGRKNNFEARIGEEIAKKLGYAFKFVPSEMKFTRRFFKSSVFENFLQDTEFFSAAPAVQDLPIIFRIHEEAKVSEEAVFVNGNSGDYITGGHIPKEIFENYSSYTRSKYWSQFLTKHYGLWKCLLTKENCQKILDTLVNPSLQNVSETLTEKDLFVLEGLEFLGRQCSFVVNQQRAYEFFGYEWRLPMWNSLFLDYWRNIPIQYKIDQNLYKSVLRENNWGKVWKDLPVNDFVVHPLGLRYSRLVLKSLLRFLGERRWKSCEANIFRYWLDITYNSTIISFSKALFDMRGQRHAVSWFSDSYLKRHGLTPISKNFPLLTK